MKMKRSNKGFTLIELIVVIAIIGVLAGIATPSIFSYITSSQQRADQSTAKQIQAAVSLMFALDSSNTYVDNVKGGVFWGTDKKTKIRDYIHDKLGTGNVTVSTETYSLIPRPKENSHAFYMYLLPPYTVVSLKAKNSGTATTNPLYTTGEIDIKTADGGVVDENYLKERYPAINYPQVGTILNLDSAATDWAKGAWTTATIASVSKGDSANCVGWLNRGIDYGVESGVTDAAPTSAHAHTGTGTGTGG